MATTCFFEEDIKDQKLDDVLLLEFGRSSYYGVNAMYISVNGNGVIVDDQTAAKIASKMQDLAAYLQLPYVPD